MANNSEFSFHVHRKTGDADQPALYTIGVWEETALHSICHVQPIDAAMAAIRRVLEESNSPAIVQEWCGRLRS